MDELTFWDTKKSKYCIKKIKIFDKLLWEYDIEGRERKDGEDFYVVKYRLIDKKRFKLDE